MTSAVAFLDKDDGILVSCVARGTSDRIRRALLIDQEEWEDGMMMRPYWPKEKPPSILDGTWKIPRAYEAS